MATPRGVRQVSEHIVQEGRALVITDNQVATWPQTQQDKFQLLPDGSLYINPDTGVMKIKLRDETDWVPAGVDNKTLVISRDTALEEMLITIVDNDLGNGTFKYSVLYGNNTTAQNRTKEKPDSTTYVFEFENGLCFPGRHHVFVTHMRSNTTTELSISTGTIEEVDGTRFKIKRALNNGDKLLVRYIKWFKIGNPYPRFFIQPDTPTAAQNGDFWVDTDGKITNHTDINDMGPILKQKTETGWVTLYNALLKNILRRDKLFSELSSAEKETAIGNLGLNVKFLRIDQIQQLTSTHINNVIRALKLDERYPQIANALSEMDPDAVIANLRLMEKFDNRYDGKYLQLSEIFKEYKIAENTTLPIVKDVNGVQTVVERLTQEQIWERVRTNLGLKVIGESDVNGIWERAFPTTTN